MKPLVFNIHKGSFSDGKGIRSVVFFKGCPMHCPWCHNPESWSYEAEVFHHPEKCLHCGNCSVECYSGAMEYIGKYYEPRDLAAVLLRDHSFYETSGGGVTYSGGEPLSHPAYLSRLSRILKNHNIHITIETSGQFCYKLFEEEVLPFTDSILFDIKIIDPQRHEAYTGLRNQVILENLQKLSQRDVDLTVTVPFIPGVTTSDTNLKAIARLMNQYNITKVRNRFYHTGGLEKWKKLGRTPPKGLPQRSMNPEECHSYAQKLQSFIQMTQKEVGHEKIICS